MKVNSHLVKNPADFQLDREEKLYQGKPTFFVRFTRPLNILAHPKHVSFFPCEIRFLFCFFVPSRQESMTFEIIVVTGVISGGRMGQNCREDLSKLLCQLLFICDRIARGSTSR